MHSAWTKLAQVFNRISSILPYLIVLYLIWQWAPLAWRHYSIQGRPSPEFSVQTLSGETINPLQAPKPLVIAFWATWCGPCTLELKRIQRMVESGEIPRESVLAISDEKDIETIRATAKERGYSFPIGWDKTGEVFRLFKVRSTPTLVVLGEDNAIAWFTSGLSPTLELRLRGYFPGSRE